MANDTLDTKKSKVMGKDAASVEKEKKALVAIRKLRQQVQQLEYRQREPIAIIGLSCRVPMASDADDFWQLLDAGVDATREVPPERWDVDSFEIEVGELSQQEAETDLDDELEDILG